MLSQLDKAKVFRALHTAADGFVIPNPWDVGTARVLELLGFQALATTSAGFSFSRGRPDNSMPREPLLAHLSEIAAATSLPVSADLENGFGDAPKYVAQTIRLAAEAGVVGGSIEDTTGRSGDPLYAREFAAERIRAAAEAARSLQFPFTLTARAENYFIGRSDLADTIGRLQAYQEAGADVLYAPGLTSQEDIATVVREVDRPLNVLVGFPGIVLSVNELAGLGVRRISVGGSLARAVFGEFLRAATELRHHGTATYARTAASGGALNELFSQTTQVK
ncbi:MAG: isocitrate lyase/phosphoenolpyruvate mutase family protein [Polaromonas sp.]|uniref:isocitrate lyase/PEP mutase family protein n=1 Tax=Polaromonas sp. TaxID=1869339 RepID=UPI0024876E64|nr:isocitrate lyase/phosphoenolpyruvate mutase family protein [Polaromonas sp.]MDI1236248.1 isocitrate lyase/phosphoenolpyruvate mutase family protein [Polaromonas sp.]